MIQTLTLKMDTDWESVPDNNSENDSDNDSDTDSEDGY